METPDKSIMCVVDTEPYVDYYVSDEKKFSKFKKRYKENEKDWDVGEKVGSLVKSITPYCSSEVGLSASYIVFNSCLYRIGGLKYGIASRSVSYLDLKKMDKVWVTVPDMNHARMHPYPVILGGHLYVVGGLINDSGAGEKSAVLMEVLKIDGSAWEDIPNPPPYPEAPLFPEVPPPPIYKKPIYEEEVGVIYESESEEEEEKEIHVYEEEEEEEEISGEEEKYRKEIWDRLYFRSVYGYVIAGAVKIEGKAVIIVGVDNGYRGGGSYALYTYEPEDDVGKRQWRPYTNIDLSDLHSLPEQTAVVSSGQLIVFIGGSELMYGGSKLLYVLDFEKEKLHVFNLFEKIPDIQRNICKSPFLVMIEEGKFDVFWVMDGPESKSKKTGRVLYSISTLVSSTFTLKRNSSMLASLFYLNTKSNTRLCFEVMEKLHWFSLIPQLKDHMLQAVCIVDYISPDVPKQDLKMCSKILSNLVV